MYRRSRSLSALLLALVAAGGLALAACGDDEPQDVTLAEVVADHDAYDGDMIRLQGEVVGFEEAVEHYVIEDENQNRVELRPTDLAAEYEGETVSVLGRFTFADDEGRRIEIEEIEVVE